MLKSSNQKGFTMIELIVVLVIVAVFCAVLAPALLSYTEESRVQKDESAMDEVVNSVNLAMADSETFDEVFAYSIPNNYITYTDSSGLYGQKFADEEFWAPDGSGHAVTITFNPDENGNYDIAQGVVNNMTNGNGSVADPRTADGLKTCTFEEMGNQKLYAAVKQAIGNELSEKSATYKNSSYTLFIKFNFIDGAYQPSVYGQFNGTNLSPDCHAAIGSGTSEYTPEGEAIITKPTGGTQAPVYSNSDLQGGGTVIVPPAGDATPPVEEEEPEEPVIPWDGTSDTSWYDDAQNEFVINTASELAGFGQLVTSGKLFAGKTVKLGKNIDLANLTWTPMGNGAANAFAGTFDGQGHSISNTVMSCNYYRGVGFFRSLGSGAVIKNVTFENVDVNNGAASSSNHFYGVIAGFSKNLTLENVDIKNSSVKCKYTGSALVGCMEGATIIKDCDIENVTLNTTNAIRVAVFGIIGNSASGHTVDIQNCTITNVTSFVNGTANELKDVRYYSEF